MKKGAMKVVFGVAAAAFLAAPLTSFAGGTISGKVTYPGKSEQKEFSFSKFPNPKFSVGWIRSHVHSLYNLMDCIAAGRQPSPSLAEGLYLQRVLEAVRASADKGTWVDLPAA